MKPAPGSRSTWPFERFDALLLAARNWPAGSAGTSIRRATCDLIEANSSSGSAAARFRLHAGVTSARWRRACGLSRRDDPTARQVDAVFHALYPDRPVAPASLLRGSRVLLAVVTAMTSGLHASVIGATDVPLALDKYLTESRSPTAYTGTRRLEASGSGQRGWLEAQTHFTPEAGFQFAIVAEGGSGYIRSRVLRTLLEEERRLIAAGRSASVALTPANYLFGADAVTVDGLAQVTMTPLRKERALIAGTLFLQPDTGDLVRVAGRLAKNPSFWVTRVDVVRTYARINGVIMPVLLESTAQLRFLGRSTLRMTYAYAVVDHRPAGDGEYTE